MMWLPPLVRPAAARSPRKGGIEQTLGRPEAARSPRNGWIEGGPPLGGGRGRARPEGATRPGGGSQAGSITIWGIGLTLVIALFAGLVIDTWRVFAVRQDISGMADAAAIAGATAIDIAHLNDTGEILLAVAEAEQRALEYLEHQDGWSSAMSYRIVADPAELTVVLETDVDFSLLGPLLPGEDPLHITVTSRASPNVVGP